MSTNYIKPTCEAIYSQARTQNAITLGKLGSREVKLVAYDKTTGEFVNLHDLGIEPEQLQKIQDLWKLYVEAHELETDQESTQIEYIDENGPIRNKNRSLDAENPYLQRNRMSLQDSLQERFERLGYSGGQGTNEKKQVFHVWQAITEEITSTFVRKRSSLENIEVTDDMEYFVIPTKSDDDEEEPWDWSAPALGVAAMLTLMLAVQYFSGAELIPGEQIIEGICNEVPTFL